MIHSLITPNFRKNRFSNDQCMIGTTYKRNILS